MVAAFNPTKNWSDDAAWTNAKLNAFVDDLTTYINSTVLPVLPDKSIPQTISGGWIFSGLSTFTGGVVISSGALAVSSAASFTSSMSVSGAVTLGNTLTVAGAATFSSSLSIAGTFTLSGNQVITSGNGFVDPSGNEYLLFLSTASAVNQLQVRNAATGVAPSLEASGGDANIDINLVPKGTGVVKVGTANVLRNDTVNSSTYAGGDINLGTTNDGAFADVDAVNAQITFTVNVPGRYMVMFDFAELVSGTGSPALRCSFRLTDGTNNGPATQHTRLAVAGEVWQSHSVCHIFNFTTTGSKTVKLQKQVTGVAATISAHTLSAGTSVSTSLLAMRSYRVAD